MTTAIPDVLPGRTPVSINSPLSDRALTTSFVEAFKREFLQPAPNQPAIWPGEADENAFTKEFGVFLEALLLAQETQKLPTNTGDAFRDRIAHFLEAQRWPIDHAHLPETWQEDPKAGNFAEISLVCQALLTAVLNRGGGGGESTIPPHGR